MVEAQMREFLPGVLHSRWRRLTSKLVYREDGVAVAAFSGRGLVVRVESRPRPGSVTRREHVVVVERRDAPLTHDDMLLVVDELFYRSKWRSLLFDMAAHHPGIGKHQATFSFAV